MESFDLSPANAAFLSAMVGALVAAMLRGSAVPVSNCGCLRFANLPLRIA
jgi:hypothetical protein